MSRQHQYNWGLLSIPSEQVTYSLFQTRELLATHCKLNTSLLGNLRKGLCDIKHLCWEKQEQTKP